jgi:hypothetical protein
LYNPCTWRLRQEDHELEAILGYILRSYLNQKKKKLGKFYFGSWVQRLQSWSHHFAPMARQKNLTAGRTWYYKATHLMEARK